MTTSTAIIVAASLPAFIAYLYLTRTLGLFLWLFAYGESFPDTFYVNPERIEREALWVPVLGEICFVVWIVKSFFRWLFNLTKTMDNFQRAIEDSIMRRAKDRKLRKHLEDNNYLRQMVLEDPEGVRKALEEVGEL